MVSLLAPHLTNPHGDLIAKSVIGMAHFAGTGPAGSTCRACAYWGCGKTFKRDEVGELCPRRCKKFSELLAVATCATGVPHDTPSCRHYTPALKVPKAVRDKDGIWE